MVKNISKFDVRSFGKTYEEIKTNFRWEIPEFFNVAELVDKNEGIALIDEDKPISYNEVKTRSNGIAKLLSEIGIRKGDVVGMFMSQSKEFVYSILGIYKLGAIALTMSTLLGVDALRYRIKHSGAKVVITEPDMIPKLKEIGDIKIISEGGDYHPGEAISNWEIVSTRSRDPAHLLYTSGTTGEPKGVLSPHSWVIGHLPAWQIAYDLAPKVGDTYITPSDWAWMGGLGDLLMPSLYYGCTVIAYKRKGRLDVHDLLSVMEKYGVTGAFLVPTALRMMKNTDVRGYKLRLRAILSGGEVVNPDLISWAKERLDANLNQIYGQTEANLIVCNSPLIMKVKPEFTGKPTPGHEVVILKEDGTLAKPSELGEIAVKLPDPVAMIEYFKSPEATAKKFRGGYLWTGDLGFMDEEGYVKFVGRVDDIIKISAYRLNPEEVEAVLNNHPAVASSAVVGVEDPLRGTILAAFIVLKQDFEPSEKLEKEIRDFVKDRLAAYAYPRIIRFVKELPMTVTGKLRRSELRERLRKELSLM